MKSYRKNSVSFRISFYFSSSITNQLPKRKIMRLLQLTLLAFILLCPEIMTAYPRFGAFTGEKCSSCHFQQSGGGIRTERGNLFAAENLMMKTFQSEDYEFDPQIKDGIRMGGDIRMMSYYTNQKGTSTSNHIQMEGVLYGGYKLSKSVSVYLSLGFNTLSEVYGQFNINKPFYVKAGLFVPDYGIKILDHRSPIRYMNGFDNFGYFTGIESGYIVDNFEFTGYFGNKNPGTGQYSDKGKMGILTTRYLTKIGDNSLLAGVSVKSATKAPTSNSTVQNMTNYGMFGSFGIANNLSLLGQFDLIKSSDNKSASATGKMATAEISYIIMDGLHVRYQFDYLNLTDKTDDAVYMKHTIGTPLFFATGFEVEPMIQFASIGKNFIDPSGYLYSDPSPFYLLMTHFYF